MPVVTQTKEILKARPTAGSLAEIASTLRAEPVVMLASKNGIRPLNVPKAYCRQIAAMRAAALQVGNPLLPGLEWIAHGYNINGPYACPDQVLPAPIYAFDEAMLVDMPVPMANNSFATLPFVDATPCGSKVSFASVCGSTARELADRMSIQAGIQGAYAWFAGDLAIGRDTSQLLDSSFSFSNSVLEVRLWKLQVRIDALKAYLDPDFKASLEQIRASMPSGYHPGTTPIPGDNAVLDRFFATYGVYFLTGIYVGGIVCAKSSVDDYGYVDQSNFTLDASASLLSAVGCSVGIQHASTLQSYQDNAATSREAWGGDPSLAVMLCADQVPATAYQNWVASVPKNPAMIDFVEASPGGDYPLAGIWRLVEDPLVASYIKDYFTGFYAEKYHIPIDESGSYRRNLPYTIVVKTSDDENAGTDATITLALRGTRSTTGPTRTVKVMGHEFILPGTDLTMVQLPTSAQLFERGSHDVFNCPDIPQLADLGEITDLQASHDNSGDKPGWKVEYIEIGFKGKIWRFGTNVWLATDEGGISKWLSRTM